MQVLRQTAFNRKKRNILVLTSVAYILVLPKRTAIMINCQIIALLACLAQLFLSWARSKASTSPSGSRSPKSYFPCQKDVVTRCAGIGGRPEVGKIRTDVSWASSTGEPRSAHLEAGGIDSLGVSLPDTGGIVCSASRCFISWLLQNNGLVVRYGSFLVHLCKQAAVTIHLHIPAAAAESHYSV